MASEIDTVSKRARLPARKNPYWQGVSGGRGGVSLGYRRPARGAGTWIAKIVVDGQRLEERLGYADDDGAPLGAIGYKAAVVAALEWSRQQHAAIEGRREAGASRKGPTVGSAIEAYIKQRAKRSAESGSNAASRLRLYALSDEKFSATQLSKLRASMIEDWRSGLLLAETSQDEAGGGARDLDKPKRRHLSESSINRLTNDLRAALNSAAERHRRELPPHLPAEIRAGTKAVSIAPEARKQLLTDAEVRRIVEAAFEVDEDGDFSRLVLLAAATGARYSQLTALRVSDVQANQARIMVPGSKKGRAARAKAPAAVPVTAETILKLRPALDDRDRHEPLLLRWAYRNVGPFKWEKDSRRPWGPAYEVDKFWAATVAKAEVSPDTIMYALRHSSIVRGLRAGLPVRLVAALHDTSSEMIEAHYSAHIIDATEELARRSALSLTAT